MPEVGSPNESSVTIIGLLCHSRWKRRDGEDSSSVGVMKIWWWWCSHVDSDRDRNIKMDRMAVA